MTFATAGAAFATIICGFVAYNLTKIPYMLRTTNDANGGTRGDLYRYMASPSLRLKLPVAAPMAFVLPHLIGMVVQEIVLVFVLTGTTSLRATTWPLALVAAANMLHTWPWRLGLGHFPPSKGCKINGFFLLGGSMVAAAALVVTWLGWCSGTSVSSSSDGSGVDGTCEDRLRPPFLVHAVIVNCAPLLDVLVIVSRCTAGRHAPRCCLATRWFHFASNMNDQCIDPMKEKLCGACKKSGFWYYGQHHGFTGTKGSNRIHAYGRCCCCCSLRPGLEDQTSGVHRPPVAWASDQPQEHLSMQEYATQFVATGKGGVPSGCPYSGKYRAADGGGNAQACPWVGQGGHHYAVNVPAGRRLDPSRWPDAKRVVDELILRWKPAALEGTVARGGNGGGGGGGWSVTTSVDHSARLSSSSSSSSSSSPYTSIRIGSEVFWVVEAEGTKLRLAVPYAADPTPSREMLDRAFATTAAATTVALACLDPLPFVAAPNNINSLACYIATLAIHEFFWTDSGLRGEAHGGSPWVNLADSFLDLQCLYGLTTQATDRIRLFEGEKLKPDAFADPRMARINCVAAMPLQQCQ